MRYVEIDKGSGFCFGVVNAIKKVEETLERGDELYCLGDIVHNGQEVNRLESKGLKTINREQYFTISKSRVLLRAHGEPPQTYNYAKESGIEIIDATCPVVLQLQRKIRLKYESIRDKDIQIVLYGKPGHAEVVGLLGQTEDTAIVIESILDIDKIDFTKGVCLFSQTTKSIDGFNQLVELIRDRLPGNLLFEHHDTICRQVSNRIPNIKEFAGRFDLVLFVSGKKSSNGKILYEECKKVNPNSYMISDQTEINYEMIKNAKRIGICGATSTPRWLMEKVEDKIRKEEDLNEKQA
ncbi:MAG: 4-hydroxy-3-methylbut-2-enyl diphosphate reductase [Bacteroidales bacterium]